MVQQLLLIMSSVYKQIMAIFLKLKKKTLLIDASYINQQAFIFKYRTGSICNQMQCFYNFYSRKSNMQIK